MYLSVFCRILDRMSLVTVPAWVTRPAFAVLDCRGLARWAAREFPANPRNAARLAALEWALEGGPAPVSGETTGPPDLPRVLDEFFAAAADEHMADSAAGVADALGWLVGYRSTPGLELPTRRPDGSLPTWEQLYAAGGGQRRTPEDDAAARREARAGARTAQVRADLALRYP